MITRLSTYFLDIFLCLSFKNEYTIGDLANVVIAIFTLLTVIAAFITAYFALKAIKENTKSNKAGILSQYLDKYLNTMKIKNEAEDLLKVGNKEASEGKAIGYYRELSDLLWSEFNIWRMGYIDDEVILIWAQFRYQLWTKHIQGDIIAGDHIGKISYQETWNNLAKVYFLKGDKFLEFMNEIHSKEINLNDLPKYKKV